MTASRISLLMETGATFSQNIFWKDSNGSPVNLSGYSVDVLIKNPNTFVRFEGTHVTVTAASGQISLVVSASDTTYLTEGEYDFEVKATSPGNIVTRLVQGHIRTLPSFF